MKKLITLFFLLSTCLMLKAIPTAYYWTGSSGANYGTVTNWKTGGYSGTTASSLPTSSDTVRIGNGSNNATITLDIDTTISVLIIEGSGQIFINGSTKILSVTGNIIITNTGTTGGGTATINITGGNSQTLSNSAASSADKGKLPNVTINKSGGTLTLSGYITMGGSTTLDYVAGTISYGTSDVIFYYGDAITGSFSLNNAEFQFNGANFTVNNTLTVTGNLELSGSSTGVINGSTIQVQGNVSIDDAGSSTGGGSATIQLTGTGSQSITSSVAINEGYLPNVEISNTTGTISLSGVISIGGNWTNNAPTANISYGTAELFFNKANSSITVGGTYTTSVYKATFGGLSNSTCSFGKDTALDVKNQFTLRYTHETILNNHSIEIEGNLELDNTDYVTGSAELIISGSGNQKINSTVSANESILPSILVAKSSGTLLLKGNITIWGSWVNNYSATQVIDSSTGVSIAGTNNTITIGGTQTTTFNTLTLGRSAATGTTSNFTCSFNKDTAVIVNDSLWIKNTTHYLQYSGHSILLLGNLRNDNTYNAAAGGSTEIILGGSNNQTITSNAAEGSGFLPSIRIQKSGGTVSLIGIISVTTNWTNNYSTANINYGTAELYFFNSAYNFTQSLGGSYSTPVYKLTFGGANLVNYSLTEDSAFIVKDTLNLIGSSGNNLPINSYSLNIEGNIVMNNNSTNSISSTFRMRGGNNQTLAGSNTLTLQNLIMNKSAGTFTLNKSLTVTSTLTLTKGNIISGSSNLLTLNNGATVSGASNNSFVSGPVKKIGNAVFTFPIGKSGNYKSLVISAPSTSTDAFTAEYFNSKNSNTATAC